MLMVVVAGPLRPGDLASRTGITSGGMTKAVDRLELGQFVERSLDGVDRRSILINLTPLGREVVNRVDRALEEVVATAIDESPDMVRRIVEALGLSSPGG